MKKMKKRRELDALVNGKSGRKKTKGQHELLRADSESSDVEEFSIPEQAIVRKRMGSSRMCATCLMGCGFFLLMACLVAVAGLVWVHVELKRDVDLLQASIRTLETGSAKTPDEFQQLHTNQQQMEKTLNELQNSDTGIKHIKASLTTALKQIQKLNETTSSILKSLASSSVIQKLPDTVQNLQQDVADLGSNMKNVQKTTDDLQQFKLTLTGQLEQLELKVDALTHDDASSDELTEVGDGHDTDSSDTVNKYLQQELSRISTDFTMLNTSVHEDITKLKHKQKAFQVNLEAALNRSSLLDSRLSLVEVGLSSVQPNLTAVTMQGVVQQAVSSVMEELRNVTMDMGAAAVEDMKQTVGRVQADLLKVTANYTETKHTQQALTTDVAQLQNSVTVLSGTVKSNTERLENIETASTDEDAGAKSTENSDDALAGGDTDDNSENKVTGSADLAGDDTGVQIETTTVAVPKEEKGNQSTNEHVDFDSKPSNSNGTAAPEGSAEESLSDKDAAESEQVEVRGSASASESLAKDGTTSIQPPEQSTKARRRSVKDSDQFLDNLHAQP